MVKRLDEKILGVVANKNIIKDQGKKTKKELERIPRYKKPKSQVCIHRFGLTLSWFNVVKRYGRLIPKHQSITTHISFCVIHVIPLMTLS